MSSVYVGLTHNIQGWIRVGQIWTFFALGIAGVLPLYQGRHSIKKVTFGILGIGTSEILRESARQNVSGDTTPTGSLQETEKVA